MRRVRAVLVTLLSINGGLWFWAFSWHPHRLTLAGRSFTEHRLDLGAGGQLRILRDLLSSSEASEFLSMARSCANDSVVCEQAHPVCTPCHVLADDIGWKDGMLSDFLRPIIEQRLLPYMKLALGCGTLDVAQLLVRHYGAPRTWLRSFPGHTDHMAFGTAVMDLTPVPRSGLWVAASPKTGAAGTVFVPLKATDVAVHGWDVTHGVELKEDHERISVVLWTRPREDLHSGLCSWYLKGALEADTEAAYHLGVEAWRQRLLGNLKLKVLEETMQAPCAAGTSPWASLRALGGARQTEKWKRRCDQVARRLQDLRSEAEALKEGQVMKELGHRLGARPSTGGALLRSALRKGWEDARSEMGTARLRVQGATPSSRLLCARLSDLQAATELLENAGLAVFDAEADRVSTTALEEWLNEFQKYWDGTVLPRLQRLSEADRHRFQFREVCSRSSGRFDVRLPSSGAGGHDLPWASLVRSTLGDAKELSRGVLLSTYGSETQPWHRDSEHLFEMPLPMHALTIFVPLVEPSAALGFPSFLPGSQHLAPPDDAVSAAANAVTPLTRRQRGAWLAFDSRVVHRGEANVDHEQRRARPLLYFVYAKPWFQDLRNFPPDAPSLLEADPGLSGFYTL